MSLQELEKRLTYFFSDKALLIQALTHRSYGQLNYERLEFLGDAILNCVIAISLFNHFSQLKEGTLSRWRAALVREQTLVEIAYSLLLPNFIRMGDGEIKSGGQHRASILADVCESLIGAIFLDGGMAAAYRVIDKLFVPLFEKFDDSPDCKDPKTSLQELCQSKQFGLPFYEIVLSSGAAHEQYFDVCCSIARLSLKSYGGGRSRRAAEQQAARSMIELINANFAYLKTRKNKNG